MEVTCVDISEMPYSYCDMDCDQEFNKSDIEEHCSDCLCVGGLEDLDQQDMPATKAWRPTSVVKERNRPKTLSYNNSSGANPTECIRVQWSQHRITGKYRNP